MRIAMYTDSFFPQVNGVATAVVILANSLAQAGHHIFVQAPSPKDEVDLGFLHPNVTVKYVRSIDIVVYPDMRLGTSIPLFLKDIRNFDPDIIHVHTPLSVGLEGFLISRRLKVPLVQTFHTYFMDVDTIKAWGLRNDRLANLIAKGGWRLNRVLAHLCDVTIAPTNFVAKDLRRHHTSEPIVVCPNLLPENAYSRHTRRNQKARTLLYVGRLSPEKRVDLLIQAYAIAREKNPTLELAIIGDGPERKKLFDLSLELRVGDGIRWFGKVPHHELMKQHLFHQGDIFVTLSRFETYGYTTLEAMAHELPVIALASKANTEVIGKAGFLVPDTASADKAVKAVVRKIEAVCQKDLTPLRRAAFAQAQKYHPRDLLPKYIKVYEQAISDYHPVADSTEVEL